MSRRKPTTPRREPVRVYFAPALGLALWLGVCVVAWISIGNLTPGRFANNQAQPPATQDRQQHRERGALPEPPISKNDNRPSMAAQHSAQRLKPAATADSAKPQPDTPLADSPPSDVVTVPSAGEDEPRSQPDDIDHPTHSPTEKNAEPKTTPPEPAPTPDTSTGPTASPHVSRAQLTSGIENREPIDRITEVFHTQGKTLRHLYYFTEITGLSGATVTHNWWHEGKLIATVTFRIGGNSWRIYSQKRLPSSMTGPWRVVLADSQGNTLTTARFVYKAP